jgi:hypothetical protein
MSLWFNFAGYRAGAQFSGLRGAEKDTLRNHHARIPKSETATPPSERVGNEATLSWVVRRCQVTLYNAFPISAVAVLLP